jgi:hypothetical protein
VAEAIEPVRVTTNKEAIAKVSTKIIMPASGSIGRQADRQKGSLIFNEIAAA